MALSLDEHREGSLKAHSLIKDTVLRTPLLKSGWLSKETQSNVYMKMESEQITRSFKLRGAANKLLQLKNGNSEKHVVTASSGNHGLACLYIASKVDIAVSIYSANDISETKEKEILQYPNAKLIKYGSECCEAETFARKSAKEAGLQYISPYNDSDVIFGQGTIGVELLDQLPNLDAVFIPVGGGGLAAGIAGYLKSVKPSLITVGCQPAGNCAMYECVESGFVKEDCQLLETFADGVAGGVEQGSVTFDGCKNHIDKWVLLEEEEIERAVYDMMDKEKKLVEGAAGLAVAAIQKSREEFKDKNVALIICGANISNNKVAGLYQKFCCRS